MDHSRLTVFLAGLLLAGLVACGQAAPAGNPVQTAMAATLDARPLSSDTPAATDTPDEQQGPPGKIAYVCQYSKLSGRNQICLIDADGSGQRVLTGAGDYDDFFPSVSPDGNSVLFVSTRTGRYQIYEFDLTTGDTKQLSHLTEYSAYAPEVSPDGAYIVYYAVHDGDSSLQSYDIWIAQRDGSHPTRLTNLANGGWDPVWSPDGTQILFASQVGDWPQLFIINADGANLHQVTDIQGIRGRNDWSPDGLTLATYIGAAWDRDIYTFDVTGENLRQLTDGLNNLAPSFSPDGQWITFMSYRDHPNQDLGCEIYIMRVDGTDLRRLTNNDICDWQPRWGP